MTMLEDDRSTEGALVPLNDATDAARCGHKASGLAWLLSDGYLVPDGFVVPAGAKPSKEAIAVGLKQLGPGPYAVRSSGFAEDLDDASFAGQYESVLGVDSAEGVVAAIDRVRRSAESAGVDAYRAEAGATAAAVAVIVQDMIDADTAGVTFSANPITGDPEVVIEAVAGLADRLMDGTADPDRWVVDGSGARSVSDSGVIDTETAERLAEIASRIAASSGQPQDVEWAIRGDALYLLQTRPITNLPTAPDIEVPPGRWMKDTGHFSGPMTPIGASILLPVLEELSPGLFEELGMPLLTIRMRSIGGEVYTQDVGLDGKHRPGSPPPWWLLAVLGRFMPAMRRRMATAAAAADKLEEYPRLWEEQWREECLARVDQALSVDLGSLDDEELLAELGRVVNEVLLPHLTIHFRLTMPQSVGVFELYTVCRDELGWDLPRVLDLLGGLSETTTTPSREIAKIARQLPADVVAGGLAAIRGTDIGPRLDEWMGLWGLRTIDLDPGSPTIAEGEALVVGLLASADRVGQVNQRRDEAVKAAREEIASADWLERFDRALAFAQVVYPQREDNVPYTQGLPCGLVRRVLLEVGGRLVERGVFSESTDVVYLEVEELGAALVGSLRGETPRRRVRRRRAERAWVLAHPGPTVHGPPPVPPPDIRAIPRKARRVLEASLWAIAEELTPPNPAAHSSEALAGVGASPGRYTGQVRLVRSEAELSLVKDGDVLVCPTTSSSWAMVFPRIGALVTDGGGMLAHPAIIAREYDLPAVLATGSATSLLEDGQIVTVDGLAGRVEFRNIN